MNGRTSARRESQTGSALVIVLLITVIMTLLGVSFLLMAETEARIAQNERLATQALYAAEGGVRVVQHWFDSPSSPSNPILPDPAAMDLTLRLIDDDGDPATPPHLQDGSTTWPYYKQGVDLNGDSTEDQFLRPYRGSKQHALLGTPDGPDIRIDEQASSAARTFLRNMSEALYSGYPNPDRGTRARIMRIDVYAPPYIDVAGNWTRYGLATIEVVAGIFQDVGGSEQKLAERTVQAVINEIPYYAPIGPMQSGDEFVFNNPLTVNWGTVTSISQGDLPDNLDDIPASHPRDIPGGQNSDLLLGWNDNALFAAYRTAIDGMTVQDPWFRYIGAGPILGAPAGMQPYPFPEWNPPDPGTYPLPGADDNSGLFQSATATMFPVLDYDFWKRVATSGHSRTHYYIWVEGSSFKENGYGTQQTFRDITDGQEGIFFFDTKNKQEPEDFDGDGRFDNLTPPIVLSGGTWGTKGLVYLNATRFQAKNIVGRPVVFNAPGEPFQDRNQNGEWDAGENWINLTYPNSLSGTFRADATDTLKDDGTAGVVPIYNRIGPDISDTAAIQGILYTNGEFDSTGYAVYYGSVLARSGVVEGDPVAGSPMIYWDGQIPDNWPPRGSGLPRVTVTKWLTE